VAVDVVAIDLVLLVVLLTFVSREVDRHVDRFVLAEVFAGEFVDVLPVDDRAEEVLKKFVLTIGPLVGGGQPEAIRGDNHLGICR